MNDKESYVDRVGGCAGVVFLYRSDCGLFTGGKVSGERKARM